MAEAVPYADLAEYVLLLTNESDCAGIKFKPYSLDRVMELRRLAPAGCEIWVDGGVTPENLPLLAAAGADRAVMGRAVFSAADPAARIRELPPWRRPQRRNPMSEPYRYGIYEKALFKKPLPQLLEDAARAGFDNFELSLDETDERLGRLDWDWAERSSFRQTARDCGVQVYSTCFSGQRRFPMGTMDDEKQGLFPEAHGTGHSVLRGHRNPGAPGGRLRRLL